MMGAMSKAGSARNNSHASGTRLQPNPEQHALSQEFEAEYIRTAVLLARTIHARDAYPDNHGEHLEILAARLTQRLGLSEEEVRDICWAACLYDIGKPGAVLGKPGPLTDREWALMRDHPAVGEKILAPVDRMRGVANSIRHHQERWDGTGYPDGLRKETIPLGARILSVAVAYCVMSARPYQSKKTSAEAESQLNRQAGTQSDPKVVESFTKIEVLDPHTGFWKELTEAMKDHPRAVSLTA